MISNRYILLFLLGIALAIAAIVTQTSLQRLWTQSGTSIKDYISAHGDRNRLQWPLVKIALRAKNVIPDGACIMLSNEDPYTHQIIKYNLYPVKLTDSEPNEFNNMPRTCDGRYFLDLHGQIKTPPVNWQGIHLSRKARIFAINGARFYSPVPTSPPGNRPLLAFIIFTLLIIATGACLMAAITPKILDVPLGGKLGGSYLIGFTAIAVLFWPLMLIKVPLSNFLVYSLTILAFFCSYFLMLKKGIHLGQIFSPKNKFRRPTLLELLGVLLIGVFILAIISYPIAIIDEAHIWILKSKIFFYTRVADLSYLEYTNTYYPLFWPTHITLHYIFAGGVYDEMAKWASTLVFLSSLGLLKTAGVKLGMGKKMSWAPVLVFLICFQHWTFITALPENIFIALLLAAMTFYIYWSETRDKGFLYLVALSLAGLVGVKFEGAIAVAIFLCAYLFAEKGRLAERLTSLQKNAFLLLPFVIQIIWLSWLTFSPVPYSIYHLIHHFSFSNIFILLKMSALIISSRQTKQVVVLIILTLFIKPNRRPWSAPESFLLLLSSGLILFSFTAGTRWLPEDLYLYYPEVLTRLCSRATPFLTLLWLSRVLMRENSVITMGDIFGEDSRSINKQETPHG